MCGIVGIASGHTNGFSKKEADTFSDMLYFDALRGFDSTGVFGVDKHSNVELHKEASQASVFLGDKVVEDFFSKAIRSGLFMVGHNRAATRGEIKDANAHPFCIDDKIILVQNGTWRGDHKTVKDTEVDTEALAHIIAENDDIEEALSKVKAAYALTWFNVENHTLNLVRNYERPLWLAKTKSNGLVWCSEPGFLMLAAARNSLELDGKPEQLEPHTVVSLKITGNHWVRTDTKVNPFRPIQTTYRAEIDDDTLENWPFMGQRINNTLPAIRAPHVDGPAYIAQTFAEVAAAKLNEYHLTKTHAPLVRDAVCGYMVDNKTKKYIVELDDFLPANNNPNCTTFHVYGKILSVESGTPLESAAIHWFLYNKTAAEALEYVTSGFYEIEFAACRLHTFNDKICIVAVMASNVVHIPAIETLVQ